jgi:hypothetical protein
MVDLTLSAMKPMRTLWPLFVLAFLFMRADHKSVQAQATNEPMKWGLGRASCGMDERDERC